MSPVEIIQIIKDGGSFVALVVCLVLAAWKAWPLWVDSVETAKKNGAALKEILDAESVHRARNHEAITERLNRIESDVKDLLIREEPKSRRGTRR